MGTVNINNQFFDENEVILRGKTKINKTNKTLRIVGGILFGLGIVAFISIFMPGNEKYKTIEMLVGTPIMAVAGAVLLGISFIKRDPLKVGTNLIEKETIDKSTKKEQINETVKKQIIKPDKTIEVDDNTKILIQTDMMIFKIVRGQEESKVYGPNDISAFELIVDDEEIFNSKNSHSESNLSFHGKSIGQGTKSIGNLVTKYKPVAGTLISGAGEIIQGANADRKAINDSKEETRKTLHKYTFVLRLNDLKFPSYVAKDISIEVAEELGNTFAIIYSNNSGVIELNKTTKKKEKEEAPVKEIATVESPQYDKFEELKKYKELLDAQIITQEEFDAKKKELLK